MIRCKMFKYLWHILYIYMCGKYERVRGIRTHYMWIWWRKLNSLWISEETSSRFCSIVVIKENHNKVGGGIQNNLIIFPMWKFKAFDIYDLIFMYLYLMFVRDEENSTANWINSPLSLNLFFFVFFRYTP